MLALFVVKTYLKYTFSESKIVSGFNLANLSSVSVYFFNPDSLK